jgi:hypothetical protein
MAVQIDSRSLPQSGRVDIRIHVSAEMQITAAVARRRVSRLVISEIGNLLHGGEPALVVGERMVWRVPVVLAYPDRGPVGQAGTLDVDVETGEILVTPHQVEEIRQYAHFLAQRTLTAAE